MNDDEREIRRIIAAQADGWNRGDARAFGEACRDDVGFTNVVGMRWDTKSGFVDRHAEMFRGPFAGSELTIDVERIRFVQPETAIVEMLTVLSGARGMPPGIHASDDGALRTQLLEVFVKSKGRWAIAACHNTAVSAGAGR